MAIRPKGAGGHFWVGVGGTSFQFVGDVSASADPKLRTLFQDQLREVTIPGADALVTDDTAGKTTGVLSNPAPVDSDIFRVEGQPVRRGGEELGLEGSARFVFATDSGVLAAWAETTADGQVVREDGPTVEVFDGGGEGMAFFGIALRPAG